MPWNDQSGGSGDNKGKPGGGPWGSGPRQPWGSPPPRGPRRPPQDNGGDLEDMLRRFRENFRGRFGGGDGGGDGSRRPRMNFIGIAAGLLVALWLASGFYAVDAGEQAVVTRFGAYTETRGPGLHYHLPAPIEDKQIVDFAGQRRMEIGDTAQGADSDSLMITGDRNIVDIGFVVLWRLSDPSAFVFNVENPEDAIRAVAESAMREVVGTRELQNIITDERAAVEQAVETLLQNILNSYDAGVQIQAVQLQRAVAPSAVSDAFDDVIRAGQDRQTAINQAEAYRNQHVPQARGRAAQMIEQATAYSDRVVREANGEASRFLSVYEQYRRAPQVTRQRLYLETMERVYSNADTVIVDRGAGVTPYIPMQELRRNTRPAPQPSQTPAPAAPAQQPSAAPRAGQR